MAESTNKNSKFGLIMAIYLLGLLVGGLYVGMVAPVRTVIQDQFGIGNEQGIWLITIYALFYASFIPVIGKLADRHGRKNLFLICMVLFCAGAAICGISGMLGAGFQNAFTLLLFGRVLQAIGACGIIPLANAEIGTSAPPEKRGFALGITAATSGFANVLGAGVGSLIIALVGQTNWQMLFFGCIPIGIGTFIAGLAILPQSTLRPSKRMDVLGSVLITLTVLLLLLSIQAATSANSLGVIGSFGMAPLLIGGVVCFALFVVVERRAEDPVFNPAYAQSRPVLITMGVSFFIGCAINSMTLVPEFAEVALSMPLGSGGIYMVVIGLASFAGPPLGGKFIDKFGPKPVLMAGLAISSLGYVLMAFLVAPLPSVPTMVVGLAIVGVGLGFSMGAPVNYMILENTAPEDSNSAISTVTLVRQVALSLAPALYVAFITTGEGSIGYQPMFIAVAVACALPLLLMLGYHSPSKEVA